MKQRTGSRPPSRKELRKQQRREKKQRREEHYRRAPVSVETVAGKPERASRPASRKRRRAPERRGGGEPAVPDNFLRLLQQNNLVDGAEVPEDAEIEYLERKLGLRKAKDKKEERALFKGLEDVGLGGLGEVLKETEAASKRRRLEEGTAAEEGEEEASSDGEQASEAMDGSGEEGDEGVGGDADEGSLGEASDASVGDDSDGAEAWGLGGSEDEEDASDEEVGEAGQESDAFKGLVSQRVSDLYGRDLASAAAGGGGGGSGGKYVPPHLRAAAASGEERYRRLARRVRGLLNRLSEENVESIALELRAVFASNPRAEACRALTECGLALCVEEGQVQDAMARVLSALVTAVHVLVGPEVGAHFMEEVVRRFVAAHEAQVAALRAGGRDWRSSVCANLLLLLCFLYTHRTVHCQLVYDVVRRLVASFTELDVELLLLALRHVGFRLRGDDPGALKDMVAMVQERATTVARGGAGGGGGDGEPGLRTQVMLDLIADLRNNRRRQQHEQLMERERRLLKLLQRLRAANTGSGGADTQFKVTLADVLAADERGRWWIPGARFVGHASAGGGGERVDGEGGPGLAAASGAPGAGTRAAGNSEVSVPDVDAAAKEASKLEALARRMHMNTDVRRSIFVAVAGASDYLDAFDRVLQLGLKEQQDREVSRVLVHCCGQEAAFNPFYAHLAARLCEFDQRHRFSFQLTFWDQFKELGKMPVRRAANVARMLAHMVGAGALTLAVLKVVEWAALGPRSALFFRLFFASLLSDVDEEGVQRVAVKLAASRQGLGAVHGGVSVFLDTQMGTALKDKAVRKKAKLLKRTMSKLVAMASV